MKNLKKLTKPLSSLKEKCDNALIKGSVALSVLSTSAFADDPLASGDVKEQISDTVQGYLWLVPLLVLAVIIFFVAYAYNDIRKKTLNAQAGEITTSQKVLKIGGAFVLAVIVSYILIGMFGKVFVGKSFADSWSFFVVDQLKALLGIK